MSRPVQHQRNTPKKAKPGVGVTQEGNLTTPAYLPTNTPSSKLIDGHGSPGVTHRARRLLFCDAEIAENRGDRRDALFQLHQSVSGWLGYRAGGEMIAPWTHGRWDKVRRGHGHNGRGRSVIESIEGQPRYWRDNEPKDCRSILNLVPLRPAIATKGRWFPSNDPFMSPPAFNHPGPFGGTAPFDRRQRRRILIVHPPGQENRETSPHGSRHFA